MIHRIHRLATLSALMVLGGTGALLAQQPDAYDFFVKVHGQGSFKAEEGQRGTYGLGAGSYLPVGSGFLGLELSYLFAPGSTVQGVLPPPDAFHATSANSSFSSKHTSNFVSLRVSYLAALSEDWAWQIGVGLGSVQDKLDFIGDFNLASPYNLGGHWNTSTSTSGLAFQPYVGTVWHLTKTSSLEVNLVDVIAKRQEGTPTFAATPPPTVIPAANVYPTYDTSSYNEVRLELGYTFHF